MVLTTVPVWPSGTPFRDMPALEALYNRAFPEWERRPLTSLMKNPGHEIELFAFYADDAFCGMACVLNTTTIAHIIYLAVEENMRGQGLGSGILSLLHGHYQGKRVIVDVEQVHSDAKENDPRRKRMAFYARNGYRETEIRYPWRGEDYVILSFGGDVSKEEWRLFWQELDQTIETDYL